MNRDPIQMFNDDSQNDLEIDEFGWWLLSACTEGVDAIHKQADGAKHLRLFLEILVACFDDSWFSEASANATFLKIAGSDDADDPEIDIAPLLHAVRGAEIDDAVLVTSATTENLWRVACVDRCAAPGAEPYVQ